MKTIEIIDIIVEKNIEIRDFWSSAKCWAPLEAAEILTKSRLDWQVCLSKSLHIWNELPKDQIDDGKIILAWVNLGALVEGTMKLMLSVYYKDYKLDIEAIKRRNKLINPDGAQFNQLKIFYSKRIKHVYNSYKVFLDTVQHRRNAIHAFKNRKIGNMNEFRKYIRRYYNFLFEIDTCLPYP
jgi:hypothetical protein